MKIDKSIINEDVYAKIKELANFLDIEEVKIINNFTIFGFYKYWIPYKEKISTKFF